MFLEFVSYHLCFCHISFSDFWIYIVVSSDWDSGGKRSIIICMGPEAYTAKYYTWNIQYIQDTLVFRWLENNIRELLCRILLFIANNFIAHRNIIWFSVLNKNCQTSDLLFIVIVTWSHMENSLNKGIPEFVKVKRIHC